MIKKYRSYENSGALDNIEAEGVNQTNLQELVNSGALEQIGAQGKVDIENDWSARIER